MAIVKAKFTRKRSEVKTLLRYIVHRPGQERQRLTRDLFDDDLDGPIAKEEGYERIDQAPAGTVFFHVILNFSQKWEDRRKDLNLRDITRQSKLALEERLKRRIGLLAVEHDDHTELRHIHAIVMVKLGRGERLTKEDWQACRNAATESARLQRRALDLFQGYRLQRQRRLQKPLPTRSGMAHARGGHLFASRNTRVLQGSTSTVLVPTSCTCPRCQFTHLHDTQLGSHSCPSCGFRLYKKREVTLQLGKGRGRELSL
jgi:hypothetical protein